MQYSDVDRNVKYAVPRKSSIRSKHHYLSHTSAFKNGSFNTFQKKRIMRFLVTSLQICQKSYNAGSRNLLFDFFDISCTCWMITLKRRRRFEKTDFELDTMLNLVPDSSFSHMWLSLTMHCRKSLTPMKSSATLGMILGPWQSTNATTMKMAARVNRASRFLIIGKDDRWQ